MKVLMINYDLNKAGKDYAGVYKVLRSYPYMKPMESCWFIKTSLSVEAICEQLKPHIDANDRLLVSEFSSKRQGWLTQTDWDWLNQNQSAYSY